MRARVVNHSTHGNSLLQVDVLPLEHFNAVWRPNQPNRLRPVYVEALSL